jgi:hypothetical protein
MDFNPIDKKYPEELIDSSFRRERDYLLRLVAYNWIPKIVEINPSSRVIAFEWYDNELASDWEKQLEQILTDLHSEQIYKPSIYPKYFFTDNAGTLKAFNFYTAFDYKEQPVDVNFYRPILNSDRAELIDSIAPDGKLDLKDLTYHAFNSYVKWPGDPLPKMYTKIYG